MTNTDRARRKTRPAAWLLILPIRFYQKFITPYTPATCRYYPTCSEYAVRSLRTHGALKGLILVFWRLMRCNPWSSGGVDHTPAYGQWRRPAPSATHLDADTGEGTDTGTQTVNGLAASSFAVSSLGAAKQVCGTGEGGVIPVASSTLTCGDARCGADETARAASRAPNAGRAAA